MNYYHQFKLGLICLVAFSAIISRADIGENYPGCMELIGDPAYCSALFPDSAPPPSQWVNPYLIDANNCHNGANSGVSCAPATTGILACYGNTSGPGGHTINWTVASCAGANAGVATCKKFCAKDIYPPYKEKCWEENPAGNTPTVASGPGLAAATALCLGQCKSDGTTPTCLPLGKMWPTPTGPFICRNKFKADWRGELSNSDEASCNTCCDTAALFWNRWVNCNRAPELCGAAEEQTRQSQQVEFRKQCKLACSSTAESFEVPVIKDLGQSYGECMKVVGDPSYCKAMFPATAPLTSPQGTTGTTFPGNFPSGPISPVVVPEAPPTPPEAAPYIEPIPTPTPTPTPAYLPGMSFPYP